MSLLTVYLEKTKDLGAKGKNFSVIAWADKNKVERKCVFPWYSTNKPVKRNKFVMINCYKWQIEWLN